MVVVWGTHTVEEVVDRVTDYCPVHRGLHEFDLVAFRSKAHLYGISPGKGHLLGHEIQSDDACRHARQVDPAQIASAPAEIRYADQLAEDARWREQISQLDVAARGAALREALGQVFVAGDHKPPDRVVNNELKKGAAIGAALTVVLFFVGAALQADILLLGFFAAMVGTILYLVVAQAMVRKRLQQEAVTEAVRLRVTPLAPSRDELKSATDWAVSQGYGSAKRLNIDTLVGAH